MGLAYKRFDDAGAVSAYLKDAQQARLLGGGTLLMRRINEGDTTIGTLVRLADPALKRIEVAADTVRLGAAVTMSDVLAHPDLAWIAPAARLVGGPAVRAAATVGGNLFAHRPYGDFGVALLALGAAVHLADAAGEATEQALDAFFAARRDLPPGTVVLAVSFPRPAPETFRFLKVSRVKPKGAAVLTLAAVIELGDGCVSRVRVALGAMAETPIRARAFETALEGQPLAAEAIEAALPAALDGVAPASDAVSSAWYRRAVLPVHLRRLFAATSH